jgi:hypothetical protein
MREVIENFMRAPTHTHKSRVSPRTYVRAEISHHFLRPLLDPKCVQALLNHPVQVTRKGVRITHCQL